MLRINIRQLWGKCVQARNLSFARPLCAKNEHVESSSKQFESAGAPTTQETKSGKETIEDVLRQSSKSIGIVEGGHQSVAQRLFMNEVDEDLLKFPEVVDKSVLDEINTSNTSKIEFFNQHLSIVNKNKAAFDELKKFDIFKHNIPKEYGGHAYSATELALATEPECQNVSVALALGAHRNVCSAITEFGSTQQKEKYLPLLGSGELIGTTCMYEKHIDVGQTELETKAEYSDATDEYIFNGSKMFVINSINSQLFLVYAQTRTNDMLGEMNDSTSAFLVDANTPGITIDKRDETIGSQYVYQSTVHFDNVRVKSGNLQFTNID